MKRYCEPFILQDLYKKMVFIGGPRQVGKTTLSKSLAENFSPFQYLNWDQPNDKKIILQQGWGSAVNLVIFDELHKYPFWKRWIKGIYDTRASHQNFLVTGSARLDVYRRGGDSLLGRYHYWRIHPLSLDEAPSDIPIEEVYRRLLSMGGFPEPFLKMDEREARRWRRDRLDRILREDIRDLEAIRHLQLLELFIEALRERVGGLITLANLAEDLQVASKTLKHWLAVIEKMYIGFCIVPYTKKIPRAILKPPKFYFYDNGDIPDHSAQRLENLVATHLLKRLHFIEDYYGYRCSLHYIRDKEGREVDFVTIIDGKVIDLIEVKWRDSEISTGLKYYNKLLQPRRAVQIVGELSKSFEQNKIEVMSPIEFFKNPPWDV